MTFRSWSVAAKDVFDDNAREEMRRDWCEGLSAKLEKMIRKRLRFPLELLVIISSLV